jgi:hypothetical protein
VSQQQLSEERRRLVGFVRRVVAFRRECSSQPGASWVDFERIPWEQTPLSSLRMAAADIVEWCQDVAGGELARLDSQLKAAAFPTLTAMRNGQYRQALGILARDTVRNEAEWHVLNRLVVDMADSSLSSLERDHAERLLGKYRRKSTGSA